MKTRILIIMILASLNLAAQNDTTNDAWENNGNDGKIIAEEVCVKPSEVWPDYVFKPSYYLMSIEEKEAFTKQNHHLPSIESETEVHNNGIDLGKSQADILKEVEEAHLYIFQLNNLIKDLQQEIDELKQQVNN